MRWVSLFVIVCLLVFSPVLAVEKELVASDFSSPLIVDKPFVFTPGEPVTVSVYNGGLQAFNDLLLRVEGLQPVLITGLIDPRSSVEVQVPVPLELLLSQDNLSVTLTRGGELLDSRDLPVVVIYPSEAVVLDPFDSLGPSLFVFLNNDAVERRSGVEVEVSINQDGRLLFAEWYGPFGLAASDSEVWRFAVPQKYLTQGEVVVDAIVYEWGVPVARLSSTVMVGVDQSASAPVFSVVILLCVLVVIFLLIDVFYHRRSLAKAIKGLRL